MACIYSKVESPRRYFGDILQHTNFILDFGATYHMTPKISNIVPGLLVESNKYIEVADEHFITAKQTGKIQINICYYNGKPFIATLYHVLFAPDLCD